MGRRMTDQLQALPQNWFIRVFLFVMSNSAWIIGGVIAVVMAYVLVTEPQKTNREIAAFCTLYPHGTWIGEANSLNGEQHSVDCDDFRRLQRGDR